MDLRISFSSLPYLYSGALSRTNLDDEGFTLPPDLFLHTGGGSLYQFCDIIQYKKAVL